MSGLTDMIKLTPAEPCEFSTSGGAGWYTSHMGELVRRKNTLAFDLIDEDTGEREPIELVPEADGFYHWREQDGEGHWCFFLAETATHTYLTGNWRGSDGEKASRFLSGRSPRVKHSNRKHHGSRHEENSLRRRGKEPIGETENLKRYADDPPISTFELIPITCLDVHCVACTLWASSHENVILSAGSPGFWQDHMGKKETSHPELWRQDSGCPHKQG